MTAKKGDTVKVHYTGTLEDGTVFDSSREREPLSFTLGAGQVVPGFETAIEGMQVGQQRKETIEATSAYGERREDLLFDVPRGEFPDSIEPQVGMPLEVKRQDGTAFQVSVATVSDESVTLDANHPLAGRDLTFEIELVEIVG